MFSTMGTLSSMAVYCKQAASTLGTTWTKITTAAGQGYTQGNMCFNNYFCQSFVSNNGTYIMVIDLTDGLVLMSSNGGSSWTNIASLVAASSVNNARPWMCWSNSTGQYQYFSSYYSKLYYSSNYGVT